MDWWGALPPTPRVAGDLLFRAGGIMATQGWLYSRLDAGWLVDPNLTRTFGLSLGRTFNHTLIPRPFLISHSAFLI